MYDVNAALKKSYRFHFYDLEDKVADVSCVKCNLRLVKRREPMDCRILEHIKHGTQ